MLKVVLNTVFCLFFVGVFAQVDSTNVTSDEDELLMGDPASKTQVTSLLPEGMGPVKRFFWAENGLMRKTNFFELTPEKREREILVRRRMLQTHQAMGFAALGCMVGSAITGQVIINNSHSSADNAGKNMETFKTLHKATTTATMITYGATALLQLLAPPPIIIRKNQGWSNMKAHRTLAYIHFGGMVLTPVVGRMIYGSSSLQNGNSDKLRQFHQVAGYVTTSIFASAVLVMKF